MEARDLRIGNYVYGQWDKMVKQGRGERTQLYRIQTINPQTAEKYDPIPLTEDWLVKFGFKSDYDKSLPYQKAYFKDECIIFSEKLQIIIEEREGDLHTLGKELKHVHQLQNLYFALTGSELEVKQTTEV